MINWKTSLIAVGALIALPLSTYAIQFDGEVNHNNSIQESGDMNFARRIKHGRKGNRGSNIDRLMQNIDLSDEQSQQIKAIEEESKATADEIKQQMRLQHEQMKDLMASDASVEEIRSQYQEAQGLRQQMSDNRFETMLEIREVLTPEQRSQIAELMEQHRGKFRDR